MEKSALLSYFSKYPEKYYRARILEELGFQRFKCKKCGRYYWALEEKPDCGDVACKGRYELEKLHRHGWDLLQAIRRWEEFFEARGHKVIEPYPVVARWRDDLFFVIASIADFQPWVLRGVAEPPGNPLVVAQPCLRFTDLSNVGWTSRHFTLFFMGGQHAFGLPDYWIDEAIEHGFNFLTKELKIKPEEITYKEDAWAGGGNFGPSMEAFAYGIEIVNHVFMQFEETPHGFREMKMRVIDTGWGLERVAWIARGTLNSYEAVFPEAAKLRRELLGIKLSEFRDFFEISGILDEKPELRKKLKIPEELEELAAIYAILDHTRALAFALADGGIPSNVGGGYNLRILLRRVFSLNERYSFGLDIVELINSHVRYYGRRFKRFKNMPDVEDIVAVEYERYRKSLINSEKIVKKYLKKGLDIGTLIELYESHGVPPEKVAEIAAKEGIKVEIPQDFYERISKKQERQRVVRQPRDLPATQPLYYELPPEKPFTAKVLWVENNEVVLDRTAFYPVSGGQDHDTGLLRWRGGEARVAKVYKEGKAIVHVLEGSLMPKVGEIVEGIIDVERRRQLTVHHTAVHIVNGAARKVLGPHVWQAGAEKTVEKARLDITHYKPLSLEDIRKIEDLANSIVRENLRIRKLVLERTEAEKRYGFTIYQGGVVPEKKLRIVEIPGFDVEACGGTHCNATGEVGFIKIIRWKRIQDGVSRIELVAGKKALEYVWDLENRLKNLAELLKVPEKDLEVAVRKLLEGRKRKEITGSFQGEKVKLGVFEGSYAEMEKMAEKELKKGAAVVIALLRPSGLFVGSNAEGVSAIEVAKTIAAAMGGNAGGNGKVARGGGKNFEAGLKKAKELAELLERKLSS